MRPFLALLLVTVSGCAVPAASPPVLEDPTPLARCAVQKSAQAPLVTEWPATEKAHLEGLLKTGMVAVAYDGCTLKLLEDCHPSGSYAFHRTTTASDTLEITSLDELYAKLPLGAASLQGELRSSGRLAIDTTAVGQFRYDDDPSLPDTPACRQATHVVRALSVGAFDLRSGGIAESSGDAHLGPASAGSQQRRTTTQLRAAGDPSACATVGDKPHAACRAPLQLFLTPAVIAAPKLASAPLSVPVSPPPEPAAPPPTAPAAPDPSPSPPPEPAPKPFAPPPPPPASVCDAITAKVSKLQPQAPMMLHLPRGGTRVTLLFENNGDVDVELPSSDALVVLDRERNAYSPIMFPIDDLWHLPVTMPAHSRRQLQVIVRRGLTLANVLGIRLGGVSPQDKHYVRCTLKTQVEDAE